MGALLGRLVDHRGASTSRVANSAW